jgi:hypothetical protein
MNMICLPEMNTLQHDKRALFSDTDSRVPVA